MLIHNYATLDAPPEVVKELLGQIDRWSEWMPNVKSSRVTERDDEKTVVGMTMVFMGVSIKQTMEITPTPEGVRQHQTAGRFKRWDADWKLQPSDNNLGTTVSFTLDVDPGLMGSLISKKRLAKLINEWFARLVPRVDEYAIQIASQIAVAEMSSVALPAEKTTSETLIQVFQTAKGLEIWLLGKRYVVAST
jgi:ribosome-associated toxin RatA of RatAB toxin-antitoxin module